MAIQLSNSTSNKLLTQNSLADERTILPPQKISTPQMTQLDAGVCVLRSQKSLFFYRAKKYRSAVKLVKL